MDNVGVMSDTRDKYDAIGFRHLLMWGIAFFVGMADIIGTKPFVLPFFAALLIVRLNIARTKEENELVWGATDFVINLVLGTAMMFCLVGCTISYRGFDFRTFRYICFMGVIVAINIFFQGRRTQMLVSSVALLASSVAFEMLTEKGSWHVYVAVLEVIIYLCLTGIFTALLENIVIGTTYSSDNIEELTAWIVVAGVCFWGFASGVFSGDSELLMPMLYGMCLFGTVLASHRYGGVFGVAVAATLSTVAGFKLGNYSFVGAACIVAIGTVAGRNLAYRLELPRRIGSLIGYMLSVILAADLVEEYLFTRDGMICFALVGITFALTPRALLLVHNPNSANAHTEIVAKAMNRMTSDRLRELEAAFKRIEYSFYESNQEMTRISLSNMANLVAGLASDLENFESIPRMTADKIIESFSDRDVLVSNITALKNSKGHREYYMTAKTKGQRIMLTTEATQILTLCLGHPVYPLENSSAIISEDERVIVFADSPSFSLDYYVRRKKKKGVSISGDSFSAKCMRDGNVVLMISDGMGSGSTASMESSLLIDIMEELLDVGFRPEYSIEYANECISVKNSGSCFTTFDLGIIDLYTGKMTLYKQGAAPTYIYHRRRQYVECVRGASLPVGIIAGVECDICEVELENDDVIIMISDGVFSNLLPDEDEDYMLELLKNIDYENIRNARELADAIMEETFCCNSGNFKDDVTVIASVIHR